MKPAKALTICLITLGVCLAVRYFKNPLAYLSLVALGSIAVYRIDRKNSLDSGDYLKGFAIASRHVSRSFQGLSMPDIKKVMVNPSNVPQTLKEAFEAQLKVDKSTEWFDDFRKRSRLIVGTSGSGKSHLQQFEVADFLVNYPEGRLFIIDLDYGSSHEGSEPNYWFNLSVDHYIATTYENAKKTLTTIDNILEDRANLSKDPSKRHLVDSWQPILLVIDEWIALYQKAQRSKEDADLLDMLLNILNRGIKRKITCICGIQQISVKESGISLAAQDSFNILLLKDAAISSKYLRYIDPEDEDKLIKEVKSVRSLPGCKYASVAKIRGQISVKVVPQIDLEVYEFDFGDPVENWWKGVYTPGVEQEFHRLADSYSKGEIDSPLKDLAVKLLGSTNQMTDSNSRYQKLKAVWGQTLELYQGSTEVKRTPGDSLDDWWASIDPEILAAIEQAATDYKEKRISRSPIKDLATKNKLVKHSEIRKDNPKWRKIKDYWDGLLV